MRRPKRVAPPIGFNPRAIARVTAGTLVTPRQTQPTAPVVPVNRNFNDEPRPPRRVPIGFVPTATTNQIIIAR